MEILVTRNGPALLEANPAGLLSCIEMVTPRVTEHKTTSKERIRHLDV